MTMTLKVLQAALCAALLLFLTYSTYVQLRAFGRSQDGLAVAAILIAAYLGFGLCFLYGCLWDRRQQRADR